ncbi:chemotaxis protein CheA [Arenibacterium halophilum]|uniref:Chemotaxis protein CheA n=1 Tax=Arenibacterium halophilum TaxID=2583821 RepID=A0ABY2XAF3_9RHOB|nr:chemotaxis protein CheA [Arenibacterium halophilum]TMV12939.1 chemotaxis protein CheA [Arenibacterium halophilum]
MSASAEIRQTFFQECDELLEALDDGLYEIDQGVADGEVDAETVNAVFRSVHSIKGGAAAFGLDDLVHFAHQFETVLDVMRDGQLVPNEDVMKVCHRAADHLSDLVAAGRDERVLEGSTGADLIKKLSEIGGREATTGSSEQQSVDAGVSFQPLGLSLPMDFTFEEPAENDFSIQLIPSASLYSSGNDVSFLLRELIELGEVKVSVDTSELPDFDEMDCSDAYFKWSIDLRTTEAASSVRDVFEFVDGMCELDVTSREPSAKPSGETEEEDDDGPPALPLLNGASEPDAVEPPRQQSGRSEGKDKTGAQSGPKATVRVNLDLVDRLINMVGELVINQAVLTQCIDDAGLLDRGDLATSLAEFKNLARDIQESVMAIRAQSVKPLFQRMARIVREAAELSGKDADFQTEEETTEVDKTIIERLVDPLTHMIRNAVDHGLESRDDRIAAGKPDQGTIMLSAAHRSGRVLIEVSDDGAGINRPKVLKIATEKGLVSPDAQLKDSEIDNLLFMPGFSTADKVSNLSGRGVGMDVVKSAIQKLGGRVNIQSTPGKGTTMSISLPLTLAVLDGMVVDVAGQTMVVPITAIVETLRPKAGDIHRLGAETSVVSVRNNLVPIIDLGVVFGHRSQPMAISDMVLLLVESDNGTSWALAVDQIFDQRQVVIKGLETNYGHVPGVAAATILGDGNIALIIDPEETAHRNGPVIDQRDLALFDEVS